MKTMQTGPMNTLTQRIARLTVGLGLAATLAFGAVMPTLAADPTEFTVTGASLALNTATEATGAAVTLSGLDQTSTFNIGLTINDPSGTGAGWKVTATSTTFEITADGPNKGKKLATGASTVKAPTGEDCFPGSTCTAADPTVTFGSLVIPSGQAGSLPTPATVYNADAASGLGKMVATLPVEVSLKAGTTFAGTYNSTITLALVSTP